MKKIVLAGAIVCLGIAVVAKVLVKGNLQPAVVEHKDTALLANEPQQAEHQQTTQTSLPAQRHPENNSQCENIAPLQAELAIMRDDMRAAESKLYESLINSNISRNRKKAIYHAAGFSVSNYQIKEYGFVRSSDLVMLAFDSPLELPTPSTHLQVMLAFSKSNYTDIIQMVENGDLTQNSSLAGQTVLSTLLLHTQLQPSALQQLLNAGLRVTFADLIFATLTKQDMLLVDTMASAYGKELNTAFETNGKTYNLVTLSAEMLHYPALQLWSSYDISHTIESDFYSSLDILPVPTNEHEYQQATAILDFLVKYGVQANYPQTLSRINRWTNHSYHDLLQLSDRFEQLTGDGSISEEHIRYLEQMRQAQSHYYYLLDTVLAKQADCGITDTEQYALFDNGAHKNMQHWLTTLPRMDQLGEDELLAVNMSLATQKAIDAGDKQSVITLLEQYGSLGGNEPESDQLLFLMMVSQHASTEQLIKLSEYSPMPEQAIFLLIAQQRIEDIPALIPYGLNVEATDQLGQTPVQFANQIGLGLEKVMQLSDVLNLNTN